MNIEHPNYRTGGKQTSSVSDYIEAIVSHGYADGQVERASELAKNAIEGLARLVEVLADKGVLTQQDVLRIGGDE